MEDRTQFMRFLRYIFQKMESTNKFRLFGFVLRFPVFKNHLEWVRNHALEVREEKDRLWKNDCPTQDLEGNLIFSALLPPFSKCYFIPSIFCENRHCVLGIGRERHFHVLSLFPRSSSPPVEHLTLWKKLSAAFRSKRVEKHLRNLPIFPGHSALKRWHAAPIRFVQLQQ